MTPNEAEKTIHNWILTEGPCCTGLADFAQQFNQQLQNHNIAVDRTAIHPLLVRPMSLGLEVLFEHETGLLTERELHTPPSMSNSPLGHLIAEGTVLHASLRMGQDFDMDALQTLSSEGYTDFVALPINISGKLRAGLTMATKSADGFPQQTISLFQNLRIVLAPVLLLLIQRSEHRSILKTYLGADAGERVWDGQIHRGDSETLEAAICFCDLRGFTELSGHLDRKHLLDLINDVFAHLVACISTHGGQVLKFMGDGLLATFVDKSGKPLCGPALNAASDAIAAIDTLRALRKDEGKTTPRIGIGLHVGEVLYGNIGAPGRLDFTVIGNAVNQTARIEGLCERIGRPILMSEDFATAMNFTDFPQGEYTVKGFEEPIRVFGLDNRRLAPK